MQTAMLAAPAVFPTVGLDSSRNRLLVGWGYDGVTPNPTTAMQAIDLDTLTATMVTLGGDVAPEGGVGFIADDPAFNRLLVHPGTPNIEGAHAVDFYTLDPANNMMRGMLRVGIDQPPPLSNAIADGSRGLQIYGGRDHHDQYSSYLWRDGSFPDWTRVEPTADPVTGNSPGPRADLIIDTGSTFFPINFFGGTTTGGGLGDGRVWRLNDASTTSWVEQTLSAGQTAPSGREGGMLFNPQCITGAFGFFGGRSSSGYENDTGFLQCTDRDMLRDCQWSDPVGSGTRPPARAYGTVNHLSTGELFLFGGTTDGLNAVGDAWILSTPCSPGPPQDWTMVTMTGTAPSARRNHAITRADTDRLLLFGGDTGTGAGVLGDGFFLTRVAPGMFRSDPLTVATDSDRPLPRTSFVMVGNGIDGRIYLYGGVDERRRTLSDFWELRIR
jgi:hypothetical protein